MTTPDDVFSHLESFFELKSLNTRKAYTAALNIFLDWCDTKKEDWISVTKLADISEFVTYLSTRKSQTCNGVKYEKASEHTIKHRIACLSSIYDELHANGWVERNPFIRLVRKTRHLKGSQRRPHGRLTPEQVQAILALPDKSTKKGIRDQAVLSLLFGCGLRRSEVVQLRLRDVRETRAGTVYVQINDTKSGEAQTCSLAAWVAADVYALIKQRLKEGAHADSSLFIGYSGDLPWANRPLCAETVFRLFKKYCAQVGVAATPHWARATAITQLLDAGLSHRDVKEFSRHTSVSMVERYDKRRLSIDESPGVIINYANRSK